MSSTARWGCKYCLFKSSWDLRCFWKVRLLHTSLMKPFYVFFIMFFEPVPIYFSCLGRRLWRCFAAKPRNCFAEHETSSDFPSTWWRVDNDRLFIFVWTAPLTISYLLLHIVCFHVKWLMAGCFSFDYSWLCCAWKPHFVHSIEMSKTKLRHTSPTTILP